MGDTGRDKLEEMDAEIFNGKRASFASRSSPAPTAITLALFAMLLPGDEMVIYGEPYDKLYQVLGRTKTDVGSLMERGVTYKIHPFGAKETLANTIKKGTKAFYIQRSKGYSFRNALTIAEIEELAAIAKGITRYHRFCGQLLRGICEEREPLEVGADLIAGSLIKTPAAPSRLPAAISSAEATSSNGHRTASRPGDRQRSRPSLISNVLFTREFSWRPISSPKRSKAEFYIARGFGSARLRNLCRKPVKTEATL